MATNTPLTQLHDQVHCGLARLRLLHHLLLSATSVQVLSRSWISLYPYERPFRCYYPPAQAVKTYSLKAVYHLSFGFELLTDTGPTCQADFNVVREMFENDQ